MSDWLDELDKLERENPPYDDPERVRRLMRDHARELIDGMKLVADMIIEREELRSFDTKLDIECNNLRALLRRVEWGGYWGHRTEGGGCPLCGAYQGKREHTPNCELAAALGGEND